MMLCMQSFPQLPGKLGKGPHQSVRCHPYQTLLQMYLSRFLPRAAAAPPGELTLAICVGCLSASYVLRHTGHDPHAAG